MRKIIFYTIINFVVFSLFAQEKILVSNEKREMLKIMYYNQTMGNIHQNASRYSQTLTTISCNHPVKVQKVIDQSKKESIYFGNGQWMAVNVGPHEGYLLKHLLSDKKVDCFQDKYPKFFEEMNMSLTDLYYLGRLHDHLMSGRSKVEE